MSEKVEMFVIIYKKDGSEVIASNHEDLIHELLYETAAIWCEPIDNFYIDTRFYEIDDEVLNDKLIFDPFDLIPEK